MALGIMVPSPWKNPRKTPNTATTSIVGARTFNAKILRGVFSMFVKNDAPKKRIKLAVSPVPVAKSRAPFTIRYAFFLCPFETRADTSLDTANGRLYAEIISRIL